MTESQTYFSLSREYPPVKASLLVSTFPLRLREPCQRINGTTLVGVWIDAHLAGHAYPAPLPNERGTAKQVRLHHHQVEPADVFLTGLRASGAYDRGRHQAACGHRI